MAEDGGRKFCAYKGCEQSFAHHSWGKVRASNAGWFFQKDGTVWCPDHIPGWVASWKLRKNSRGE